MSQYKLRGAIKKKNPRSEKRNCCDFYEFFVEIYIWNKKINIEKNAMHEKKNTHAYK